MNRHARLALLLTAPAFLAACAMNRGGSYVGRIGKPGDAQVLASSMAAFVASRLPAASTNLVLDPTPSGQAGNLVTLALVADLRDRGFAIADGRQGGAGGVHHIRYLVTPLESGDLMRVSIDGNARASRFFVRNTNGGLQAGGPLTVFNARTAGS